MTKQDSHPPANALTEEAASSSLRQLFFAFLRIGAMSLGGGSMAWIHREVVMRRRWMPHDDFMAGVALAQVLPGVNTTNVSVYVGHRLKGVPGAGAALGGFLLGPFICALVAAVFYVRLLHAPGFEPAMVGVAAVALGMVLRVALLSARSCSGSLTSWTLMLISFVCVGVLRWPLAPVVAALAPIGIWAHWRRPERKDA